MTTTQEVTEQVITDALQARYAARHGNGVRYITAVQVRSHASFYSRRTADFIALDTWETGKFDLHFHEIKVTRSDWRRELEHPEKAGEFTPYMNRWWITAPAGIVRSHELPDGWGLMEYDDGKLRVAVRAPRHEAKPLTVSRMVALTRAVASTAAYQERRSPP